MKVAAKRETKKEQRTRANTQAPDVKERESVEHIFREFLKKKGYRATPERDIVLREIYSAAGHFDADELFIKLKQKNHNISRATVYNTLDLLVECNLVSQNSFGHKHLHYERVYGYDHHDHIVCNQCGEVFEFSNPKIEEQQDAVCKSMGFDIRQHTLQIFADCVKTDCDYKKRQAEQSRTKSQR